MKQQVSLKNRIVVMTGATSGIGKVAAVKAAATGAEVLVIARNKTKGDELLNHLSETHPDATGTIRIVIGNLNSFQSVREACMEIRSLYKRIDVLVLNAATLNFKPVISEDGIEETLQVNVLSPLLIYLLLEEGLKKADHSKIIFTSSLLHQGSIRFEDIEFRTDYKGFRVYRQSKLALILLARYLSDRRENGSMHTYSFNPGLVNTDIVRNIYMFPRSFYPLLGKSPEKGAETLNFLIEHPSDLLESGAYYTKRKAVKTVSGIYTPETGERLWRMCYDYIEQYVK